MKIVKLFFSFTLLAFAFTACKQLDYKKTKDGFPYKIFSSGSGEKIMPGNFVSIHRTIKIGDSVLQTSYGGAPQLLPVPKDTSGADKGNELAAMLLQARKGDSIQINQPVDSILKQNPQAADPFLLSKKGQSITYVFKVVDIFKTQDEAVSAMEKQNMESFNKDPQIKAQRTKDEAAIEQYLKANNIQTQRTPWGVYVQIITPGSGPKPQSGQFSMLRYAGKDLTGKEFDSNTKPGAPLLPLQIGGGGTIIGFEDAVKTLPKGAKANVYIPSVLAYGAQGRPPVIQPNQNLMFELEVVDITNNRPAPEMPPMPTDTSARK